MVETLVGVVILASIVVLANLYQAEKFQNKQALNASFLILAVMIILIGGLVLLTAVASNDPATISDNEVAITEIPINSAIVLFVMSIIFGLISIGLIFSPALRKFIQVYVVQSDGIEKRNHASSVVHTLAIIIMLFTTINTLGNFLVAGGIEGIAEELTDISSVDLLVNFSLYVLFALLGVGIFIRRNISRTLKRLGIRLPDQAGALNWLQNGIKHLAIGAIVGLGMFWVQVSLTIIWQLSVSPEQLAEQTAASQALFEALGNSLWLGFLVAITAGIGEELLFRGALQPIFGNVITSIFFVMLHSQYILTVASLIIFLVSIVFGFLRSRYTTSSAMMAHFVYNFTPFVLISILTQMGFSY